jgi:hypothetical protein
VPILFLLIFFALIFKNPYLKNKIGLPRFSKSLRRGKLGYRGYGIGRTAKGFKKEILHCV